MLTWLTHAPHDIPLIFKLRVSIIIFKCRIGHGGIKKKRENVATFPVLFQKAFERGADFFDEFVFGKRFGAFVLRIGAVPDDATFEMRSQNFDA